MEKKKEKVEVNIIDLDKITYEFEDINEIIEKQLAAENKFWENSAVIVDLDISANIQITFAGKESGRIFKGERIPVHVIARVKE